MSAMRTHNVVKLLSCLVVCSSACGDGDKGGSDAALEVQFPDGTTPDGEVSSSTSFVTLCDDYAAAACKLDACLAPGSVVSAEDCRKAVRDVCEATITGPIGTHIDGDIFFDGQAADECLAHFDVTCADAGDATGDVPVACEEAFDGTLSEGAACSFDALCKPELFCKGTASDGACSGTCSKRSQLGESCADDTKLCARGLRCGGSDTCEKRKVATGEACTNGFEQCPDSDFCIASVCTPRIALGQSCADNDFACARGLTCRADVCATPPGNVGDACDYGCGNGLLCVSGVCAAQPEAGDPCIGEFGSCGSGFTKRLQCDRATNTCIKWFALGDACGGPNQGSACDGSYCDATLDAAGTCVAYKSPGAACEPFSSECGRLGCNADGVCASDESACRGPITIQPL